MILDILSQEFKNPGRQAAVAKNFLRWRLIFVDPQCGTCFMSPFWRLESSGGVCIFKHLVYRKIYQNNKSWLLNL
jgi:hypothetical protein